MLSAGFSHFPPDLILDTVMEEPSPSTRSLPKPSDLSKTQLSFLNQQFQTHEDLLHKAPHLFTALVTQSSDLDSHLLHLQATLTQRTVSWIRRSVSAETALHNLDLGLQNLSLVTTQRSCIVLPHLGFQSFILFIYFF